MQINNVAEEKGETRQLAKEISILHSLGVEEYEISYLISLKRKREASLKWQDEF